MDFFKENVKISEWILMRVVFLKFAGTLEGDEMNVFLL